MKFRRWFGDSQVVRKRSSRAEVFDDRPDDPLIVYHGTRTSELFTSFNIDRKLPTRGGYGFMENRSNDPNVFYGPHFTDQAEIANNFAMGTYSWISKAPQDKPRVYPVYLSIQNPAMYESESLMHYDIAAKALEAGYKLPQWVIDHLVYNAGAADGLVTRDQRTISAGSAAAFKRMMREDPDFESTVYELALDAFMEFHTVEYMIKIVRKAKHRLIELGYDGIWYTNDGEGGDSWVPFHPSQIKSAIANDGTYGPSKDIRRNPS